MMDTVVVRPPKQSLATFGTTRVTYNLVTRPLYQALDINQTGDESVVRRGTVKAEQPKIVTPYFLSRAEGFGGEAQEFLKEMMRRGQADDPGILYSYSNQLDDMQIVSDRPEQVADNISARIERESQQLEAVIIGVDELWDASLMKFIFELTNRSAANNVSEFRQAGRLNMDNGVPADARMRIEEMFAEVRNGDLDPSQLHRELEAWRVFDEYEDRFFAVLRDRRFK